MEKIERLDDNRIWIGGDKDLFESVQQEAFRLGWGWLNTAESSQDKSALNHELSKRDPNEISWMVFVYMPTNNGSLKVMAFNPGYPGSATDFEFSRTGEKITLEDMKNIE